MKPPNSTSLFSQEIKSDDSPLLGLPFELRNWIYKYNLIMTRCPSPKDVYSNVLCEVWKDMPSALLAVNRQIRDEVCEILRKECAISLRVTGQGINFDSLALSSFIAYQQCTFTGIRRLRIEVWAPHPERPVETYYIWKNLRRLRDDLQACKQIRRIDILFKEHDRYPWSQDGVLGDWLYTSKQTVAEFGKSDIHHMLCLFLFLTNTSTANFKLPASIDRDEHEELAMYANGIEYNMVNHDLDIRHLRRAADRQEKFILLAEGFLKYKTAEFARKRLNDITQRGQFPMSQDGYLNFVKVWPHFETLNYRDFEFRLMGCSHHADIHGEEQAYQDNRLQWKPTWEQRMDWGMWLEWKGIDENDLVRRSF